MGHSVLRVKQEELGEKPVSGPLHLSPPLEPCTRLHRPCPPLQERVDWQDCRCQVQNLLLLSTDSTVGSVSQRGVGLEVRAHASGKFVPGLMGQEPTQTD